jgi:hypothetical protein
MAGCPSGQWKRTVNPSLYSYAGSNPAPATGRKGPLTSTFAGRGPFVVVRGDIALAYFRTTSPQAPVDARTRSDTAGQGAWRPASATRPTEHPDSAQGRPRCDCRWLTPMRHSGPTPRPTTLAKGRSAVRRKGSDVSAYRDLGLSAVTQLSARCAVARWSSHARCHRHERTAALCVRAGGMPTRRRAPRASDCLLQWSMEIPNGNGQRA